MEPISTALAGFALLKASVNGLKSVIGAANDIKDVGHFLEKIWQADKECNDTHNKQANVSSLDGFKNVASSVIDRRLQQEMMHEVRTLIQMRFGVSAWEEIVAEKAKREREAKEAQAAARREKIRKAAELEETIKTCLLIAGIVAVSLALFIALMISIASAQRIII